LTESTVPAARASAHQTGVPKVAPSQTSNASGAQIVVIKPQAISTEPAIKESSAPLVNESHDSIKPSAPAQAAHRVAGTYEVTRMSRVYAAPSERSQSLGDIETGTKVSVVGSHDGWLEVHSKHGRPLGYIRKEAAARIAGQN